MIWIAGYNYTGPDVFGEATRSPGRPGWELHPSTPDSGSPSACLSRNLDIKKQKIFSTGLVAGQVSSAHSLFTRMFN